MRNLHHLEDTLSGEAGTGLNSNPGCQGDWNHKALEIAFKHLVKKRGEPHKTPTSSIDTDFFRPNVLITSTCFLCMRLNLIKVEKWLNFFIGILTLKRKWESTDPKILSVQPNKDRGLVRSPVHGFSSAGPHYTPILPIHSASWFIPVFLFIFLIFRNFPM